MERRISTAMTSIRSRRSSGVGIGRGSSLNSTRLDAFVAAPNLLTYIPTSRYGCAVPSFPGTISLVHETSGGQSETRSTLSIQIPGNRLRQKSHAA